MKKIYEHPEFARVGHFQSILESEGIKTMVKNEAMSTVFRGTAGLYDMAPELWVVEEEDVPRATELLEALLENDGASTKAWVCPGCGEQVAGNFSECWNCQTDRPEASG